MASFHFNRPDEWRLEQGLSGVDLPALDQTGEETVLIHPHIDKEFPKDEETIKSFGDPKKIFTRELEGWKGCVINDRIVSCSSYVTSANRLSDTWNGRSIQRRKQSHTRS